MESLTKLPPWRVIFLLATAIRAATSYEVGSVSRGFRFAARGGDDEFSPFLLSSSREFAAGFLRDSRTGDFTLGVVGINSTSDQLRLLDTIWMANRDDPFRDQPELLFANDTGSIVVIVHQQVQWNSLSSSSTSSRGDFLELSNAGNLRLLVRSSPGDGVVVWQSFDHPTDTLLQGQNFTQSMTLVSSISTDDPRSGPYTFRLEDDRLLLLAGTEPYWTDAALREHDNGTANSTVYMRIQDGYLGLYQREDNRVHFVPFSSMNRATANFTRRARIDPDGNFRVYYFQDGSVVDDYSALKNPCEFPASCGSYAICSLSDPQNKNKSCKCPTGTTIARDTSIAFSPVDERDPTRGCHNDAAVSGPCGGMLAEAAMADDFMVISNVDYFANKYPQAASMAASLEGCRNLCLANCSCQAFFFRNDSRECFLTSSLRSMVASSNPLNLGYVRVSTHRSRHHRSAAAIVVPVLAAVSGTAALICGCFYCRSRRRKRAKSTNAGEESDESFLAEIPGLPKRFRVAEMESAKNASRISTIQLHGWSAAREFLAELATLARMGSHSNLVPLLGYCMHEKKRYIIYENTGSRSLEEILASNNNLQHSRLDWPAILLGIARGLAFLHSNAAVHGDLVPRNILLDDKSKNPKLAEYGLATLMGRGQTIAPDDVRAFGAIVLACMDGADSPSSTNQRLRELGMWCTQQQSPPSMASVVEKLSSSRSSFAIGSND